MWSDCVNYELHTLRGVLVHCCHWNETVLALQSEWRCRTDSLFSSNRYMSHCMPDKCFGYPVEIVVLKYKQTYTVLILILSILFSNLQDVRSTQYQHVEAISKPQSVVYE